MKNAARYHVESITLSERPATLRLPFKFGVVTLTQAPQLFIRACVRSENNVREDGFAAELMVPKWFDKSPELSNDDNINQLRASAHHAAKSVEGKSGTPWELHEMMQDAIIGSNGLVGGFGIAELDKAILDAVCRLEQISFYQAIRENRVGMPDMDDFFATLKPSDTIEARHTVGLLDPLTRAEIETPLGDGLPHALEDVAGVYGHRYFKIKVNGHLDADVKRLIDIAAVLDRLPHDYKVTLDGNEQYKDAASFAQLLDAMDRQSALEKFCRAILYIEQPIHRTRAFDVDIADLSRRFPVILDESDDTDEAFVKGKALGYRGISSKCCKGLYRALLNAKRADDWNRAAGEKRYFLSAEDLTTQAGLGVQQDLALVNLLGLGHVERNGHHYVDGMAGAPADEIALYAQTHPDLYDSRGRLKIINGTISLTSLAGIGYARTVTPQKLQKTALEAA